MRAPDFWWRPDRSLAAGLLAPMGALAGAVASLRLRRPGWDVGVPVICIGNPTVGGSGKTPAALYLAQRLLAHGRQPTFLTRGYGGSLPGPLTVDPQMHDASQVGDEPLLLARSAVTVVARNRLSGALAAADAGADIIVMDDGFQNPALLKLLSLLVVDGRVGVGNGLCLPAGPLRAPLAPQFERAHALLVIGDGEAGENVAMQGAAAGLVVLRGRLAPEAEAAARLFGRRVLAFAGIGRPEKFFDTLRTIGASPIATRSFPDHHRFTNNEADELRRTAETEDLVLVTTEKDAVRLKATEAGRGLMQAADVLPVRLVLEPGSIVALDTLINAALARHATGWV